MVNSAVQETWRPVTECPADYEVSSSGWIRALGGRRHRSKWGANKILGVRPGKDGYHRVCLAYGGKVRTRYSHRVVAEAFLGPPPTGKHEVNHKDGNRSNNAFVNLEWVTSAGNKHHARDTLGVGYGLTLRKISAQRIPEVRARIRAGEPYRSIGDDFGVSPSAIYKIAQGKTYRSVA